MASTIQIHELTALDTGIDRTIATIRFKAADDQNVDGNAPLVIPASGQVYSYTKQIRAYMSVAPNTNVQNIRYYTNGSNGFGTGVDVQGKNIGQAYSGQIITKMTGSGQKSIFSWVSATPCNANTNDLGPWTPTSLNHHIGDTIQLQMVADSSASGGQLSAQSLICAYDEI